MANASARPIVVNVKGGSNTPGPVGGSGTASNHITLANVFTGGVSLHPMQRMGAAPVSGVGFMGAASQPGLMEGVAGAGPTNLLSPPVVRVSAVTALGKASIA